MTNVSLINANALTDTAASSDTDGTQSAYTVSVSASHNTFDIIGGSQKIVAGGVAIVGDGIENATVTSACADYNTLTLHGGTYNFEKSLGSEDSNDDDDEDSGDVFDQIGLAAGAVLLLPGDNVKIEKISASNNTLILAAGPDGKAPEFIGNVVLQGGVIIGDTTGFTSLDNTGNKLITDNVKGMTAYNVANFDTYEFRLPEMKANETVLTLTNPAGTVITPGKKVWVDENGVQQSQSGSVTVKVTKVGNLIGSAGGEFKGGEKVYLLKNTNGLTAENVSLEKITGQTGISLEYDLVLDKDSTSLFITREAEDEDTDKDDTSKDDSGKDDSGTDGDTSKDDSSKDDSGTDGDTGKDDSSTDGDTSKDDTSKDDSSTDNNTSDNTGKNDNKNYKPARVQPGTKAIAEGAAAGLALVNESANASIELLREFTLSAGSITPFVHVQGSSMRHETGSSINLSSVSLLAGLGTGIETGAGNLSVGAFFEYGKGSYTTHNSFSNYNDVDGDGNSWYMGGGILAKMRFVPTGPGHFHAEGSAHMGTLHNEYYSNDLVNEATGNIARFDMDSPYYSLHGGIGYVWNMAEDHDLDIYGKYIWTRVQGTDDTLTTSDKFDFDNMDSNRVRLGVRYSYKGSERFKPYVGAAFEHEFSGSCDSRAFGHSVAAPSFEGSSGMGELGLVMKPSETMPLSFNLGVQGYVGQKQGVSGNCLVRYEF